jgi:serine/threonine-protein phosphatase 2A regulatory subunit B
VAEFWGGHEFNINSLSVCPNGEYFVSSDDLRVLLWNYERTDTSFVLLDSKPSSMEELNEVITNTAFHHE